MPRGITNQNKDVLFKILSENYKNKSLNVYGLDLPLIKEVLPTNLPALKLDEKRADNLFLLEDESILILEYESKATHENLLKYGHYAFRVSETYYKNKISTDSLKGNNKDMYREYKENNNDMYMQQKENDKDMYTEQKETNKNKKLNNITIVIIYTGDIKTAPNHLNLGALQIKVQQVFLSNFNYDKIYEDLKAKVEKNEELTDEDVMKFIILPLTEKKNKQNLIENTVNLAKIIKDEEKQSFIIAGILSATDKFIDKNYSNRLKEWLKMTKVGRLFEEEKIEYAIEYANEAVRIVEEEKKEVIKNLEEEKNEVIKNLEEEKNKVIKNLEEEKKEVIKNLEEEKKEVIKNLEEEKKEVIKNLEEEKNKVIKNLKEEKILAIAKEKASMVKILLLNEVDILEIMKYTGISKKEILKIQDEL